MLMSARAESQQERNWVCKHIRDFCSYFKCLECRAHAIAYLKDYPPEAEVFSNERLFRWVTSFLNSVNARQGKPLYNVRILWDQFTDDSFMVCDAGADKEESTRRSSGRAFTPMRHKP